MIIFFFFEEYDQVLVQLQLEDFIERFLMTHSTLMGPTLIIKLPSFQTQGMRTDVIPYTSILSALRRITCEEGISGLYRYNSSILEETI